MHMPRRMSARQLPLVYYLQIKHYIEVRIPKLLRRGWFKDYISPEEKQVILDEAEKQRKLAL